MKLNEELRELIEADEWSITEDDDYISFRKYSPCGQDFGVEVAVGNSYDDLVYNIKQDYDIYDPSYEAYLWLDNTGHGKNGAPSEMCDVYEDMVACENYIWDLFVTVNEWVEKQRAQRKSLEYEDEEEE